jgi:Ca2+-binding RTX toxin-like protein
MLIGGGGSDRLFGMAGYDSLQGGPGDDLLDGGDGQDNLAGGEGNDTYVTDGLDSLSESAGAGDDTAITSASFQLFSGVEIETLRTSAPLGTAPLALTGNEFGQSIYGNAGDNVLSGLGGIDYLVGIGGNDTLDGGAGADFLQGGIGNDLYRVDDSGDVVYEFAGEGDDRIAASVSYVLAAGVEVETLSTSNAAATDPIYLVGNELGQSIYGNDGDNILNGRGGTDYLVGGNGNDTYILDRSSDVISELAGQGNDVLLAGANYALAAGVSIETMVAQDSGLWIELTGNELGQSLYGNSANNMIDGGAGIDYLVGGGGGDVFAFTTAPAANNVDVVGDFQVGSDRIGIDNAIFAGLDGGALPDSAFRSGTSAQDADDRVIYDPTTGALWFDADGSGAGAAIQFAQLTPNLALTSHDFVVI